MRTRIAIDTDPGIDDAVTLAVAALSPDVELCAVTTVAGNVALEQATANAVALLHALGRDDVPVAPGASRGFVRVKPDHAAVHGHNGLGGVVLPGPSRTAGPRHAVDELASLLGDAGAPPLTIVAIGPLTNIALLLALHPELDERIERIVVMGGSTGAGNVTPSAEYNTWADPEAAERVFSSGAEIWLAQLQATRHATLDARTRAAIATGSWIGARLSEMMDGYDEGLGVNPAVHDLVALAAACDPSLITAQPARVRVDTDLGPQRGATLIDFDVEPGAPDTVQVILHVDVPRLRALLVERLSRAGAPV